MLTFLIGLMILTGFLWLGFKLTGALLSACIWLFIKVPIAAVLMVVGIVFCCTIILIPVGVRMIKAGLRCLIPGCLI